MAKSYGKEERKMTLQNAQKLLNDLVEASKNEKLVFLWLVEDTIINRPEQTSEETKLQSLLASLEGRVGYCNSYEIAKNHLLRLGFDMTEEDFSLFLFGNRLHEWIGTFLLLNKEKQDAMFPALLTLTGFMHYKTAERCFANIAKEDAEAVALLNILHRATKK